MHGIGVFIGAVMPFLTLAVLVFGLFYRVRKWSKAAVGNMALFPGASATKGEMWRKVLGEVLLFSSFRKENRELWSKTWIFHVTLALIILGHSRLITDWPLRVLFGMSEGSVNTLSAWGGGIAGVLALLTCLLLLFRRITKQRVREISSGEEYGILLLLAAVLITGNWMRFVTHWDITVTQTYFASLFSAGPTLVPQDPVFLLHFFLVQLLVIYMPFGKFLHIPGIFYSKPLIVKDY